MPLTDTAIRKAKRPAPGDKPLKLRDGNGLYLEVPSQHAMRWRYDYRRPDTKKRNTLSLGTYPDVSLANARDKHAEARRQLAAGIDPGEERIARGALGQPERLYDGSKLAAYALTS